MQKSAAFLTMVICVCFLQRTGIRHVQCFSLSVRETLCINLFVPSNIVATNVGYIVSGTNA